jgi:hypothetical protein
LPAGTQKTEPSESTSVNLDELNGFFVEIFFFSSRSDLEKIALSIKNKLSENGLSANLRPYSINEVSSFNICRFSAIRYERGELPAAKKLRSLIGQSSSGYKIYLHKLELSSDRKPTPNYLSIFINDSDDVETIYPDADWRMAVNNTCQDELANGDND